MQFVFCTLKASLSSKYCSLSYNKALISCLCKVHNNCAAIFLRWRTSRRTHPSLHYLINPATYIQTSTSISSPNSYFAGEPHQSVYSYLSVGVLKLCSLPQFADLHSVLDKHEPLQQTSDRKNETEPLDLCQASQFILLPHAAGERDASLCLGCLHYAELLTCWDTGWLKSN